jgi:hypothetical protein
METMLSGIVSIFLSSKWIRSIAVMAVIAAPVGWKYLTMVREIQSKNDTIAQLRHELTAVKENAAVAEFNAAVDCMEPKGEEDENISVDIGGDIYF